MGPLYTLNEDSLTTYAAAGYALSCWEGMEVALSDLYAFFIGRPDDPTALFEFGESGKIFANRLQALERAAERYFIRHCDQRLEGELRSRIDSIRSMALSRHRIAHGIVMKRSDGEYRLAPPVYAARRMSPPDAIYEYTDLELAGFANQFKREEVRLMVLYGLLREP